MDNKLFNDEYEEPEYREPSCLKAFSRILVIAIVTGLVALAALLLAGLYA